MASKKTRTARRALDGISRVKTEVSSFVCGVCYKDSELVVYSGLEVQVAYSSILNERIILVFNMTLWTFIAHCIFANDHSNLMSYWALYHYLDWEI